MSTDTLKKGYEPQDVEQRWYAYWEKEGLFAAQDESTSPAYSIVIPPPNVTGVLHMGHAHNNTVQDILCRFRRMQGCNVLWMPGTDHAGIATQNVVEKVLAQEGKGRHDVGREPFIEKVWEWRKEYGGRIINQLKRLGASCDWDRERFTMDEGLSRAVRTVFVKLYQEGLIYRGNYIINWCHRCHTALSDLEVEHQDHDGHLYYIRYPFEKEEGGLVVATTRPETMLGDTAVAVNPNDERFNVNEGTKVILPLMNRMIPVIADEYVDTAFGTGALKITPAHDPNDFEIGQRHHLESVKVIGDDGKMNEHAGTYQGQDRFECRQNVLKALEEQGLLEKVEPYQHSVGHCYRCRTTVEPNLSKQWFVKVGPLAQEAIEAVEKGHTKIIPGIWTKTYFEWMHNIKDWCVSRQIWWGHRIPAWTCESCGELIVAMEAPKTCPECDGSALNQETDVLDTWFSSALWPFSTMGWPDKTKTLETFYPTSVLVTGFDILFFWVARMMMMGLHFMKDIPFKDVYIHALVRDANGKKMSKSKGNVIDPLHIIDKFGTDAFRFTLAAFAAQGRDIKLSEDRIEGYRNFINKLWNASRFSLMHLQDFDPQVHNIEVQKLSVADRWILSRLDSVVETVTKAIDEYKFNEGAGALYQFVWHEFCDWYLEIIKPVLYAQEPKEGDDRVSESEAIASRDATLVVLWTVVSEVLRLLHPFVPFVTEEIWSQLPGTDGSIMKATYPVSQKDRRNVQAEETVELVMGVISGIRNVRGEMNVPPGLVLEATVQSPDDGVCERLRAHSDMIINLAKLKAFTVSPPGERPTSCATSVFGEGTIFVSLEGIIDFKAEQERLSKEIGKIQKELLGIEKKLGNDSFLTKAPQDVVEGVRKKREKFVEKQEKLEKHLAVVKGLNVDS